MAKHEFGIMMNTPRQSERYDEYEPWKYECISVDDKDLEGVVERLSSIDFYWHTLSVKGKGLAYYGITLIPPESMDILIKILLLQDKLEYTDLISLVNQAKEENKYIIHFGI